MAEIKVEEGTVPFRYPTLPGDVTAFTAYRVIGDLGRPGARPLITIHGGPGIPSSYLYPTFDQFARHTGRPVVYYDQVGCGRSTHFPDTVGDDTLWAPNMFMAELTNLIQQLGIRGSFDLYGHSWGALLAALYAGTNDEEPVGRIGKIVLGSGPASISLFEAEQRVNLAAMPQEVQDAINHGEETGDFDSEEYKDAVNEYYKLYLSRVWPLPEALQEAFAELEKDPTVYATMWGPSEITVTGNLKGLDMTESFKGIRVPVLLINGEFDEVTDVTVQPWFDHLNKVKWVTLANCAHMASLERPEKYVQVVSSFLLD